MFLIFIDGYLTKSSIEMTTFVLLFKNNIKRMLRIIGSLIVIVLVLSSCTSKKGILYQSISPELDTLRFPQEKHLKNVRQLTFGGDNAEAYWSFDDKKIVFQATNKMWGADCDQIYFFDLENWERKQSAPPLLSPGKGRTTCSFFMPGNKSIVFASTHEANAACPHVPERRADGKYIWPIYESFDIYHSDLNGNIIKKLTNEPGYDAEATVSPKGDKIVFTSTRSGDLELYTMNVDGSDVRQITKELGYEGGAFFSPDGKKLIFRSSRPKTEEDIKVYKELLAQNQVMPTNMEFQAAEVPGPHPLKTAQAALDDAVRRAYGMPEGQEATAFLLELNKLVAEDEAEGRAVQGPGVPRGLDPKDPRWMSDDWIKPPAAPGK